MSRTQFLAVIAAAAVLMQLIPSYAEVIVWVAIVFGVLYLIVRALSTYPKQYRLKRQHKALLEADEREFISYSEALTSIREKYGSMSAQQSSDALAAVYERDVADLHDKHRAMLERKFGSSR